MKKLYVTLFSILALQSYRYIHAEPQTVDKILAIIYHPEGDIPVLQSDLNSGFEGKKTLDQVIFDKHVELDGKVLKVEIEEEDINRHLAHVQKVYNMTKDDTVKYAKNMGLTYDQFHAELGKGLLRERVMGYRMKGSSANDKDEALAYYQHNPVTKEATYTIKQAFIPYGSNSPSLTKLKVEDAIAQGTIDAFVKWLSPVELKESQIAADKNFIKTLDVGKSSIGNVTDNGISLVQLYAKEPARLLSFEEREQEIKAFLMRSRQEKAFNDYKAKLYATSTIKYIS